MGIAIKFLRFMALKKYGRNKSYRYGRALTFGTKKHNIVLVKQGPKRLF